MRMAELSRRSAVPVPTIKYYLRERLLPAGVSTAANQAEYGERHLRRLRLIRALTEVAGLTVATVKSVLSTIDGSGMEPSTRIAGRACDLASAEVRQRPPGLTELAALAQQRGWQPAASSRALARAAEIVATIQALDSTWDKAKLHAYADAAAALAEIDGQSTNGHDTAGQDAETTVLRVMLGDALFAMLHRLALSSEPPPPQ